MEFYGYEKPKELLPWEVKKRQPYKAKVKIRRQLSREEKIRNRVNNMAVAKKKVRRLIDCNKTPDDVFLTLTFRENVRDVSAANYEFKKFRQRLEYQRKKKLKYVVVVEFQERGAIHYHCYLFGVGFVDWLLYEQTWGHGFIRVNHITNPAGAGCYVTSYMTKDIAMEDRLRGRKSYFASRGLQKPITLDDESDPFGIIDDFLPCLDVTQAGGGCVGQYENVHVGKYFYARGEVVA
ncbi:MAG: hypothetical protein VB085_08905 [Peptococcaceae bacterium]|nr:hypothetical protein [Peptococcaceae bacterium]